MKRGPLEDMGYSLEQAERFMAAALTQARRARERTWPNPMVGAVVVKRGQIIGKGYHHRAGCAHAEVDALDDAGARGRGADLFVTLEPCHLCGRTGPCAERILSAGVARVFVGTMDPNPQESGLGIAVLRERGVKIFTGILEEACQELNEVYEVFIRQGRPFVWAKVASSLDGRLATARGDARWISGEESRAHVHWMRSRCQAIMVGAGTVNQDNPRLDVRDVAGKNPAVAIVSERLTLASTSRLFSIERGAPIWIYCAVGANARKAAALRARGAEVIFIPRRRARLDLHSVLQDLFQRGVYRLLVEGGSQLLGALLSERLVDRLDVHLAPVVLGSDGIPLCTLRGPSRVADALRLQGTTWKQRGADLCLSGRLFRDP